MIVDNLLLILHFSRTAFGQSRVQSSQCIRQGTHRPVLNRCIRIFPGYRVQFKSPLSNLRQKKLTLWLTREHDVFYVVILGNRGVSAFSNLVFREGRFGKSLGKKISVVPAYERRI